MGYKRQIAYFDLIESGEKRSSAGFCKWERKSEIHTLVVSISGLPDKENRLVKIFTRGAEELGEVQIRSGRASVSFVKQESEGDWEWEFSKLRIPLAGDRELVTEFEVDVEEKVQAEPVEDERTRPEIAEKVSVESESDVAEEVIVEIEAELEPEEEVPLHSLWDCLVKTHEILHPFGTEEEYCKIGLEDILLLKERYHVLRKNQFLFHGYYNYKYLILGRKAEDCEEYWLGVPGIYHEREKMAARMYGFEKFEGAKPRYGVGDLGYYLITVE